MTNVFDPKLVDWSKVESLSSQIAVELAKGTPTPLDDALAPFAGAVIHQFLLQVLGEHHPQPQGIMTAMAAPVEAGGILDEIRKRGYAGAVPAWLLTLLTNMLAQYGPALLQMLLDRFFPKKS